MQSQVANPEKIFCTTDTEDFICVFSENERIKIDIEEASKAPENVIVWDEYHHQENGIYAMEYIATEAGRYIWCVQLAKLENFELTRFEKWEFPESDRLAHPNRLAECIQHYQTF